MANLWNMAKEQMTYLLRGPGSNTSSSTQLISIPPPEPPFRTSLVFESHVQEAGKAKNPQTISAAWDERRNWANDTQASWQGLTAQDRKTIMLDIYLNNSAASSCVDVISKRIFSGGYVVEKIDEEAPDNKEHEDTLHEFALRINAEWDFCQLGRSIVMDKLIFGEGYSEIIWKNGLPYNLIKVDCIPMGYKANKYGQIEAFYQQLDSSRQKNWLDPENIIRWWFPHPRASIDPFAPVEKVTDAVLIDKKMMLWMQTFFRQGAKFPYHIEGASDRDEADRLQAWFLQNVMGEKNAHKLPVTWGNAKIVPTGNQGALTMDFQTGMDRMDTMVYGAFGVPPAAVSIIKVGALGGNSGEDQDKSLIYNACDPVKSAFLEKLNDRIVKRGFGITDYRYGLRYADYRSDESVSKVEDTRIKNGSRTVDEIRAESGKRPYKQGGSVPFIWSTKEVVPLARLDDLEDEQRENAALSLQTAAANADLAQTKAKQAKEPQPEQQPPAMQPSGKSAKQQKQAPQKEQEVVQLSLPLDEAEPRLFTGKTELPQWTDPEEDQMLYKLAKQGVEEVIWETCPNPCAVCLMNDKVTVRLGMPFPSGHRTPLCHPNCDCKLIPVKTVQEQEEDPEATQKLPAIKIKKPLPLTEDDLWEGKM